MRQNGVVHRKFALLDEYLMNLASELKYIEAEVLMIFDVSATRLTGCDR